MLGGCAYTFSESNALLLAPEVMRLLEQPVPLTVVETTDWNCQAVIPRTIHNVIRTSSGSNAGVMDAAALMPFGVEYDLDEFLERRSLAKPVLERRFAFSISEHTAFRKPSRVELTKVVEEHGGAIGRHLRGREYVFDLRSRLDETPAIHSDVYGEDYLEMLADSVFALCPAGDEFIAGCALEALEYGAIPIMENPPAFKGCELQSLDAVIV